MNRLIEQAVEAAFSHRGLTRKIALELMEIQAPEDIFFLMAQANAVRRYYLGDDIELCAIVNAKSGRCSEDCAFCAQSKHHLAEIEEYPLITKEKILESAFAAQAQGVVRFSIVISGKSTPRGRELDTIAEAIQSIASLGLSPCASLGILDENSAHILKQAGLRTYHHNLETGHDFFPQICTTHDWDQRIRTARLAKEKGFRLCCGGIIGLGESAKTRVDLALALKELTPESVPLNFLNPIPGTPLENSKALHPLEILKTIAVFRLILPKTDIRTCGGREKNLRGLQPLMYIAGANATMVGDYLTTQGRRPQDDIQDILDLGLHVKAAHEIN